MTPLNLFGSVGYDEDNDPSDVAATGTALATLGHFDALGAVQSGRFDDGLGGAIRTYQTENDLEPDGVLLPRGPTQQSVNEALKVHRPGPSLLPASAESDDRRDDTGTRGSEERDWFGESPSARRPLPGNIRAKTSESIYSPADDDGDVVVPRKPDVVRRDLGGATTPVNGVVATIARALPNLIDPRENVEEFDQIMKTRGYRYIPDPMGRIGEGDWADEQGRRLDADEASQVANQPGRLPSARGGFSKAPPDDHGVTIARVRRGAPQRRIDSDVDTLAYDLDTATTYAKRGEGNIRIVVPMPRVENAFRGSETEIPRINIAIREAVVANALLHRSTSPDEIASVFRNVVENPMHGPQTGRSRIKDMLIEAASNGSTLEQRLHAKGLLAVYDLESHDSAARGERNPAEKADAAINRFIADQSGEIPWAVYDPELDGDYDVESAGDDPDETKNKPRGMNNEKTRAANEQGKLRHEEAHEAFRKRGWKANQRIPGSNLRPDGITEKGKPVEVKPDTESGRKSGEKQIRKYNEASGQRGRVIYYSPDGNYSGFRGGLGGLPGGGSFGRGPFSK